MKLSSSRTINFAPLEIAPVILDIIKDGKEKFGDRAWSSMIVKRLEDRFNTSFRADGFPEELVDIEEKKTGIEI